MEVIYYQNDNLVKLNSLYDNLTAAYVNDATVELLKIVDSSGTTIAGQVFPLTMDYIADSDGNYRAAISDELAVLPKRKYTGVIEITAGTTKSIRYPVLLCKLYR